MLSPPESRSGSIFARIAKREAPAHLTLPHRPLFHPRMETLLLASSSPRRKDILSSLEIPFVAVHPDIDESIFDHEEPGRRTISLALAKAAAGAAIHSSLGTAGGTGSAGPEIRLVLGADTLVALPEKDGWLVLGKPENRKEAGEMTAYLAGKTHRVFTGIALVALDSGASWVALSDSAVSFSPMSAREIDEYLDTGDWEGAAGGYKLQGRASFHISRIDGSWSGVMGLPICELYDILMRANFRLSPSIRLGRI
ncbi:MAG: Maf family protein [Rectinemataceae bacterium]